MLRIFKPGIGAAVPWQRLALLALLALVCADLSVQLRPLGYLGGSSDDQRYLEVALRWVAHGPHAGTTHWALRHPLILALVASFRTFGISIASLLLVSRISFDLLVMLSTVMMARHAGIRAALYWLAFGLFVPELHKSGSECGLELLELLFGAASGWAFLESVIRRDRLGPVLMVLSGALLAIAVLTRETSAMLLLVYGYAWATGRCDRRGALWFALGFLPIIAWDNLWLWAQTGDALYRLHVDQSHTHIYSTQLEGGVYAGRVLLNPDLASRWTPVGPVELFWAIDPILNFFASPDFGLIFAAWLILWAVPATRPARGSAVAKAMPWLFALTVTGYVLVTWVMTLRPQPRYFLFPVYAATIAVALMLAQEGGGRIGRCIRRATATIVLAFAIFVTMLTPDHMMPARLAVSWMQRNPRTIAHFADREHVRRVGFPAMLADVGGQVSATPARIGELRLRERTQPPGPGSWQLVEALPAPQRFPYVSKPPTVLVERRIR